LSCYWRAGAGNFRGWAIPGGQFLAGDSWRAIPGGQFLAQLRKGKRKKKQSDGLIVMYFLDWVMGLSNMVRPPFLILKIE
jgi:hypothetical protein